MHDIANSNALALSGTCPIPGAIFICEAITNLLKSAFQSDRSSLDLSEKSFDLFLIISAIC